MSIKFKNQDNYTIFTNGHKIVEVWRDLPNNEPFVIDCDGLTKTTDNPESAMSMIMDYLGQDDFVLNVEVVTRPIPSNHKWTDVRDEHIEDNDYRNSHMQLDGIDKVMNVGFMAIEGLERLFGFGK